MDAVDDDTALVSELTALVLAQAAPDELVVFEETAEEYFADPEAALSASSSDQAVGFGLELAMLTPAALAVGSAVVQALGSMLSEAGGRGVSALLRRLLRRGQQPDPALTLTHDQARYVRDVALARAHALGLPPQQAHLLADSFVGALVTSG